MIFVTYLAAAAAIGLALQGLWLIARNYSCWTNQPQVLIPSPAVICTKQFAG